MILKSQDQFQLAKGELTVSATSPLKDKDKEKAKQKQSGKGKPERENFCHNSQSLALNNQRKRLMKKEVASRSVFNTNTQLAAVPMQHNFP